MPDHERTRWRDIPIDDMLNDVGDKGAWNQRYNRIMQQYVIEATNKSSHTQARQQKAMIGLTVVLALAAVAYTYITYQSVTAMREANEIQKSIVTLPE